MNQTKRNELIAALEAKLNRYLDVVIELHHTGDLKLRGAFAKSADQLAERINRLRFVKTYYFFGPSGGSPADLVHYGDYTLEEAMEILQLNSDSDRMHSFSDMAPRWFGGFVEETGEMIVLAA